MRSLLVFLSIILISSCKHRSNEDGGALKQWIQSNQTLIQKDIDAIIGDYLSKNNDPNWLSVGIVTTMHASNSLGRLAKMAGDSTDCIRIELNFYKDVSRKREIMIVTEDSSCILKVNAINLITDSVGNIIFGKRVRPLYTNEGDPL